MIALMLSRTIVWACTISLMTMGLYDDPQDGFASGWINFANLRASLGCNVAQFLGNVDFQILKLENTTM